MTNENERLAQQLAALEGWTWDNLHEVEDTSFGWGRNHCRRIALAMSAFAGYILLRADWPAFTKLIAEAVAQERERCAKICDDEAAARVERSKTAESGEKMAQIIKAVEAQSLADAIRRKPLGE